MIEWKKEQEAIIADMGYRRGILTPRYRLLEKKIEEYYKGREYLKDTEGWKSY